MCDPTQVYFEHLNQGELWLQYCRDCGQYIFYPRSHCPECWGVQWEWRPSLGHGKIYSYSVIYVNSSENEAGPYIYALVSLDEGVRLATRIVDCELQEVAIDMRVKMVLEPFDGQMMPVFRPAVDVADRAGQSRL